MGHVDLLGVERLSVVGEGGGGFLQITSLSWPVHDGMMDVGGGEKLLF